MCEKSASLTRNLPPCPTADRATGPLMASAETHWLDKVGCRPASAAFDALNLGILLSDKKPLSRLYQALEELRQRFPRARPQRGA